MTTHRIFNPSLGDVRFFHHSIAVEFANRRAATRGRQQVKVGGSAMLLGGATFIVRDWRP